MFYKLSVAVMLTVFCATVFAGFVGPGSNDRLVTVSQAQGMKDDTQVTLVGFLVNEVADEHYTFQDDTGKMVVEIDDHKFRSQKVTPGTKIRIKGEIDDGRHNAVVDVDYLEIVE